MKKFLYVLFFSIIIDRIIKIIVENFLSMDKLYVIKNFFYLTFVKNDGAAFSILSGKNIFFIIFALIVIMLLCYYMKKNNSYKITYALLLGGIIGNLIDRILFGYVIDYIGIEIINYHFPIFNLADALIVISAFFIIVGGKDENNS